MSHKPDDELFPDLPRRERTGAKGPMPKVRCECHHERHKDGQCHNAVQSLVLICINCWPTGGQTHLEVPSLRFKSYQEKLADKATRNRARYHTAPPKAKPIPAPVLIEPPMVEDARRVCPDCDAILTPFPSGARVPGQRVWRCPWVTSRFVRVVKDAPEEVVLACTRPKPVKGVSPVRAGFK